MQHAQVAEGEIINVTTTLNESIAHDRAGPRAQDFCEFHLAAPPTAVKHAMQAFNHLDREIFEVELLAATDRCQLALIDSRGQGDIGRGSGAKYLGAEAFGNYRDIGDVVGVAVAGENEVGLGNDSGNFILR